MKKLSFQISIAFFCILIVFACNTKEIRLITNVKYTMVTAHQEEGYVKDSLETSVVVTPQKVLPEFEYRVHYEVLSGEGYFVTADSTVIAENEGVLLEEEREFSITWNYIGTVAGDHQVAMMTYDNFEKSKTETLIYTIKNVEILWQASSLITAAKVNDTIPIGLELLNKTEGRDVSFEYLSKIAVGQGEFLNAEKEALETEDFSTIDQGSTELYFIPNTTGTALLSFDLRDSNGQEKTTSIELEILEDVVNVPPVAVAAIKDGSPNKGVAPFTVVFDSAASMDTDDGISSYLWNFGSTAANSDTPNPTYTFETPGDYTVTLTVTDASGETHSDTLIIIVEDSMSTDFSAVDDSAATTDDTPVNIPVLANDQIATGIMATVAEVSTPLNGGTVVIASDGSITYTPKSGTAVNDSFTYTISNGLGGTSKAQVTVSVTLGNQPPVADDDTISTPENTATTIAVLDGDQDPENGILTVVATSTPTEGGTVVINEDFTITYTPATDFVGDDTFTYTINDDAGNESTATVVVTITDVDQLPIAAEDTVDTPYNTAITITVLDNDEDPEALPLAILAVATPENGTAVIDGTTIIYTPNEGFDGVETFTYTIEDEAGNTADGTIVVTVEARETIAIEDPIFEAYLIGLKMDSDELVNGLMFKEDAENITRISITGTNPTLAGLSTLGGIEHFSNLENLSINRFNLSDSDLAKTTQVKSLDWGYTSSGSLDLSKHLALETISMYQYSFTEGSTIDLSKATKLNSIKGLLISGVAQINLKNGTNTSLSNLEISSSSLEICVQVDDIVYANANENWSLTNGYYSVDCSVDPKETIALTDAGLEEYLKDQGLDTDGLVNGLMYREDVENVERIVLGLDTGSSNNFKDIGLFTNLKSLEIGFSEYESLDLSKNKNLTSLKWTTGTVGTLNVVGADSLEDLNISLSFTGADTALDLSSLEKLKTVAINTPSLSSINIKNGNNANITSLRISGASGVEVCVQVDSIEEAKARETWSLDYKNYYSEDCGTPRTPVAITDPFFERALMALGYDDVGNADGFVFKENIENVTELNVDEKNITSLKGIEAFTALTRLEASNNAIKTVDLSSNTALTYIKMNSNGLTSILLPTVNKLADLILESNALTTIDVSTNQFLASLKLTTNPELACIQVENKVSADATPTWEKDPSAYYSEDCGAPRIALEDAVFETYLVNKNLDTDGVVNGGMFQSDAEKVTSMIIGSLSSNPKNLLGIEYFTNLESLSISYASINDLDLSKNVQLKSLLWSNATTNVLDLSKNTNLEVIELSRFSFAVESSIDLSKAIGLKEISITTANNISKLDIRNGNNAEINALGVTIKGCIEVENKVDATNNTNWTIDGDSYYSEDCDAPPKETIPFLNPILEDYLVKAGIDTDGDVNGLMYKEDAENITTLNTGGPSSNLSGLTNLDGLEYFTNLESLSLAYFSADNFDLSKTTQIKKFNWSYGSTNTLDLSQHTNLEELSFVSFGITGSAALDLTANTALQKLSITSSTAMTMPNINIKNGANNMLTSLTLGATKESICIQVDNYGNAINNASWSIQDDQYYSVDCSKGPMVAIPDEKFEQALIDNTIDPDNAINGGVYRSDVETVNIVAVANKGISSLEGIQAFTNLSTLVASNNTLKTIDLSQNPKIGSLILNDNLLTSLDISKNTTTGNLDISNNPSLSCVQVADYNDAYRRVSWIKDDTTYYSEDCSSPRETVDIPDGNFERFLMDANLDSYATSMNGVISIEDALKITTLSISSYNVPNPIGASTVSLEGIEHFSNLETLQLSYLTIDDLDLTSNTALKTLDWGYGSTNSLNLSSNTNLETLQLQTFSFSQRDITLDVSNAATLETVSLGAINNLSVLNLQNGNNSAITSLSAVSDICIEVDNVTDAINNENWNISTSSRYTLDCNAPPLTSLNPSTGEYVAPAGTEIVMDFSKAIGTFSHIGDMYSTPGFEFENRFVNRLDENVITTTMLSSGTVYLAVRIISGAMTGGTITITHTASGESHVLLAGAIPSQSNYVFPIP